MSHIQSGIWEDIDENIFVCVVCTGRLTNPKVLPCLHRYCFSCLEKQIKGDENGKVKCIKCKYDVDATHNYAADFETDFLVDNINNIDKIQKILKDKEKESCCNCTKRRIVPKAYCFNCLGYLCDKCRGIHETNPALQEHRAALLTPEDLLRRDMNSKVMFSRISPKCDTHQNKTASQCCSDCGNKVVCEKCMTENHRNHETKNLASIVDCSKEELSKLIFPLDETIDHIKKKQEHLESMSRPILKVVKEKSEALMDARQNEVSKISNRSKFVVAKYEDECSKLDKSLKLDIRSLQLSMKEEMDMVKAKYDPLISERKAKADIDRQKLDEKIERDRDALSNILKALDTEVQHMSDDLFKVGRKNSAIASEMKAHFQQIILRYDDLSVTAKSVRATGSDWIALKCIPVITSAAEVLGKDFNKEFPSVGSLAELPPQDVPQVNLPVIENDEVSPDSEINEGDPKSQLENELPPFQRKRASIERKRKFHSQSSEESKSNPDGSTEADLDIEKETNFSTWSSTEDRKGQGEEAEVFRDEDQKVESSSWRNEERATDTDVDTKQLGEVKVGGHVSEEDAASLKEDPEVTMDEKQKVKLYSQTDEEGTEDSRAKVTSPIQSRHSTDSVEPKMNVDLISQSREESETVPREDGEAIMEQMEKRELHSQGSKECTRKTEENATSSMKSRESGAQQKEKEEVISQQREEIKHDIKEDVEKSLKDEKIVKLNSQKSEDGTSPPMKPRRGSGQQKMEAKFHSQISQESKVDPNETNEVFDENSEEQKVESLNTGEGTTNVKTSAKPPIPQPRRGSVKQKYEMDFQSQISQEGNVSPNDPDEVFVESSKKPKFNSQSSEEGRRNSEGKVKPPIKPRRGSTKQKHEMDFHSQISQEGQEGPNESDEVFVESSKKPKFNSQNSEDGRRNSEETVKPPIKPRRGSAKQKLEVEFLSQINQESTENSNEKDKLSTEQKEKVKKVGGVRVFPPSAF